MQEEGKRKRGMVTRGVVGRCLMIVFKVCVCDRWLGMLYVNVCG